MVSRVLSTYESSPMSEVAFQIASFNRRNIGLEEKVRLCHINDFSRKLKERLGREGIEVRELSQDMRSDSSEYWLENTTHDLARDSDLILHDSGRILHYVNHKFAVELAGKIDQVILGDYLWKTHIGCNNPFVVNNKGIEFIDQYVNSIKTPQTWKVSDFLAQPNPKFPVVFKGRYGSMGNLVTFIDSMNAAMKAMPEGPEYYEPLADFQEYIETPSDHFTSFRVFTFADGTIIGAVLNVSGNKKNESLKAGNSIVSNHAQGGRQIALTPTSSSIPLQAEDIPILEVHKIDPADVKLPDELILNACTVAKIFAQHGVVWGGQDWLLDKDGNFYFLEINNHPGMELFNTIFLGKTASDYSKQCEIDDEAMNFGIAQIVAGMKYYEPVKGFQA